MCNNLTIVSGLNHNLLPDKLPKIKYEQAEVYWQKKYGEKRIKSKRSELVYSIDTGQTITQVDPTKTKLIGNEFRKQTSIPKKEGSIRQTRSKTSSNLLKDEAII